METVTGFILGGHKSTADGGCSHEIKRCLLLGGEEETMTNLDSVLKSRDISLSMKVHLVKAVVFPVVMYGCESWTIKKAVQFSSVAQSCPTLCDPMNRSTPGLPVHHQLLEFTQTHVHRVGDAIQPSHPLSSPSPAFNLSQHQGFFQMSQLFTSGGQSIGVSASTSAVRLMLSNCGIGEDSWESLGCEEIKPVNPKGDQSWILIGRTDAKAEATILQPPDMRTNSLEHPDAGKDRRQEEKEMTEDKTSVWHHQLNGHEFEQAPGDGEGLACWEAWSAAVLRVEKSWTRQSDWITTGN